MLENIIIAAISMLGGGGLAGVLTWKATSRKADEEAEAVAISNDSAVIEQWRVLYEEAKAKLDSMEQKVEDLRAKVDELYSDINKHRDEKSKVKAELMDARIQCEKLDKMKCERKGCVNRIPPSDAMM